MLRLFFIFSFGLLSAVAIAQAGNHEEDTQFVAPDSTPLNAKQSRQIESATRGFILALTKGDAIGLAAVSDAQIRARFANPALMLIGMRNAHQAFYKARDYSFPVATAKNGIAAQQVYFSSAKGHRHKAVYLLRPNAEGQYLVFGCVIKKLAGKQA